MMVVAPPAWRIVVVASAVAALAAHLTAAPPPLRVPLVGLFVLICPGMAVVRLLVHPRGRIAQTTLAVAVSVSITALATETLAIAGLWSPTWLLVGLAGFTAAAAACPPAHSRPREATEVRP